MQQTAYEAHPLWQRLDALREHYENAPTAPNDATRDKIDQIGAFVAYIDRFREDDGLLVQDQHVQQVHGPVNNMASQMQQLRGESPNWGALDQAVGQIPAAMQHLIHFPRPLADSATASAKRAATMFKNRLDTIADEFQQEIAAMRSQAESAEEGRAEQVKALSAEIEALRSKIQESAQEVSTHSSRLQEQVDEQRQTFEAEEQARTEAFKAETGKRDKAEERRLEAARERAEQFVAALEQHEKTSEALVESTGRNAIAGDYGAWAKKQGRTALGWTIAAVLIGLATAAALVWALATVSDESMTVTVYKSAVSIVGLIVAGYAGKQAAEHRREERTAKRLHLDLAALEPFLTHVDDPSELRTEVARRVFAPEPSKAEHHMPSFGFRRGFTIDEVLSLVRITRDGQ